MRVTWSTLSALAGTYRFREGAWGELVVDRRFFPSFVQSLKESSDYQELCEISREITEVEDGIWGTQSRIAADPERAANDLSDWEDDPVVFLALFYEIFLGDYPWDSSEDPFDWCVHYTPGMFEIWGDVEDDQDIYYTIREIITEETVKWNPEPGEQGHIPKGTLESMIKSNKHIAGQMQPTPLYLINRRSL